VLGENEYCSCHIKEGSSFVMPTSTENIASMSLPEAISWRVDARPRTTKKNTWNVTYKHLLICKFIFSTLYNLKTLQWDIWLKDKVRLIFITSPLEVVLSPSRSEENEINTVLSCNSRSRRSKKKISRPWFLWNLATKGHAYLIELIKFDALLKRFHMRN
jgi:hypothetical protein